MLSGPKSLQILGFEGPKSLHVGGVWGLRRPLRILKAMFSSVNQTLFAPLIIYTLQEDTWETLLKFTSTMSYR